MAPNIRRADVPAFVSVFEWLRSRWTAADPSVRGLDVRVLLGDMLESVSARAAPNPLAAYLAATALIHRTSRPEFEARALELLERSSNSPAFHRAFAFARASEIPRTASNFDATSRWLARAQAELDSLDIALDDRETRGTRAFVALQFAAMRTALGQPDEALHRCDEAQRWLDSAKPWPAVESEPTLFRFASIDDLALLNRLGTLLSVGRFDSMLRTIRDYGPVAPEYEASVAVYEGHGLHARGELDKARRALELALSNSVLAASQRAMAQLELALVHWDRGDREQARAELSIARSHLEKNPRVVQSAIRLRALEVLFSLGDAPTTEQMRANLASARAAWMSLLETWDQTPIDGSGIGFLGFPHRRLMLGQLIEIQLAVDPGATGIAAAFECLLEAQRRGTSSRRLGARDVTLADVRRELLGPGEGLLVYLPSWRGSHAFAVDAQTIVHVALPAHESLGDEINDTLAELREGRATTLLDALSQKLLPKPLNECVQRWHTVGIVGADLLRHVPIEALLLENGERLGLAKNVYWLPSLPAGVALVRRPRSNARAGVRWIGCPAVEPALAAQHVLGPVTLDRDARTRLERLATSVEFVEAARASVDSFRTAPNTLALFAHGICDSTRSRPSGIALAPSSGHARGTLFFEDVAPLFEPGSAPEFLLLLACGTARTTHKVGDDDSDQLGTAFLETGVRCVAMSSEPLHQIATARLAASLLEHRARGSTPAEAMKHARRELSRDARFSHPKFWSTLTLFGLGAR